MRGTGLQSVMLMYSYSIYYYCVYLYIYTTKYALYLFILSCTTKMSLMPLLGTIFQNLSFLLGFYW